MAFAIAQHIGELTDNSDAIIETDAKIVKTGIYRFCNVADRSAQVSISDGGAINTEFHTHVNRLTSEIVKLAKPKNARVNACTVDATAPVLTIDSGGTPSHPFVVGDFVTLVGAAVGGYNTAIAYAEVTAVTNTTVTVSANTSALAAFTGTAQLHNSVKLVAQGDTSNGMDIHIDEVQLLG